MSEKKPEKVVEPSPFEKWWAEVQEWRAGRDKQQVAKRRKKVEHFNDTRHLRSRKRDRKNTNLLFNIFGMVLLGIVELILGLLGMVFRFGFWIAIVGGLIWILTTFDVETKVNDEKVGEKVDEAKKKAAEVKGEVGDVFQEIADELNEFAKTWSIEIRQTTVDGKEVKVLELGTKKDEPPKEVIDE